MLERLVKKSRYHLVFRQRSDFPARFKKLKVLNGYAQMQNFCVHIYTCIRHYHSVEIQFIHILSHINANKNYNSQLGNS